MLGLALCCGCAASVYENRADGRARAILDEGTERTLGDRREAVVFPTERVPAEEPENAGDLDDGLDDGSMPGAGEEAPIVERRVISLREALELGILGNRGYKSREEGLYLQALSLASVRHGFTPQLAATLDAMFSKTQGLPSARDAGFSASVDQILPWGGNVSAGVSSGFRDTGDGGGSFDSGANIRLTQPLLRGAGHEISHEPLVQAERDLVYAIRSFELFREDFSIDVASRYYDLVQQKQAIANLSQNLDGFVFGRRQAEAFFRVGRTTELDVLRARRSELSSRDSLIAAKENYELALDRFRIFLGLPREDAIDVAPEAPEFTSWMYDAEEAVEVALVNRLDLINQTEQLEDSARGLRIAKDSLRPRLDLSVGYDAPVGPDGSFTGQDIGDETLTAGLSFEIPIDKVNDANAYRAARIGYMQDRRDYEEFRDNLVVEIESAFRELERRVQSLDIQRQLITDQEKNEKIARLRFEQGDFSNRDVVEAEEALLDARNSLINEQVNYEIARLQLLRDLGILFIEEDGMWTE
ncbi:MAG: TolC family protein [bacterium]|nr:TolC family protein [bacterium]